MSATNLPPCRCGDPDRFHDGPCSTLDDDRIPCRPPTTLENVIRSPRFLGLAKVAGHWEATFVGAFGDAGNVVVVVEAPDCEGAVTAAALRISALDAAEWNTTINRWIDELP